MFVAMETHYTSFCLKRWIMQPIKIENKGKFSTTEKTFINTYNNDC